MEGNKNLTWLCINKYLPELNINNNKQTLLKSGVTFFNLHRMEKGYFPTSLIKFQVDTNKTDISDLTNKNIKTGNRDYIIRKFTEKPRQDYRCRCYTKHTEKHANNTATLNRTHQRDIGKKLIPQKELI